MPNKFVTKLKYVEQFTVNPGAAGVTGVHTFCANGIYDPNLTGVGHQPRGLDEMFKFYQHGTVIGSKIKLRWDNSDPSNNVLVGINLRSNTTTSSDPNDYMEQSNGLFKMSSIETGSHDTGVLSYKFNNKFLGVSKPLSEADLRNTTAANPTEQAVYHVWCADAVGTNDPSSLICVVEIEYIVVFTERKDLTQS